MHIAAVHGSLAVTQLLLGRDDIEVNKRTKTDLTPLVLACCEGSLRVVNAFLEHSEINVNLPVFFYLVKKIKRK